MNLLRGWLHRSVPGLVRLACWIALIGLVIICASILWPRALPVIFAMSVGHLVGVMALACYLFSVILDSRRTSAERSSSMPPRGSSLPPEH